MAGIDGRPLFVTKYFTPQVRADLTEKGIGYVDATGNLLKRADLAIDPEVLTERPLIEAAMTTAEFSPDADLSTRSG